MKIFLRNTIAFIALLLSIGSFSQESKTHIEMSGSMNELSQQLVNPIGPYWLINSYLNVMQQQGDFTNKSRTESSWLLQPVLPIPVNKETGLILMNRPAINVYFDKPTPESNPADEFMQLESYSGIGDLTIQTALGKMSPNKSGKLMWGIGAVLAFPTANKNELGSEKYSAGPVVMSVELTKKYTYGFSLNHRWSYAGDDKRDDVSLTQFQLIYYKQLGNGWQIGDNPTWEINDKLPSSEKYNLPIGLGIFKTTNFMGSAWRFGITPRYFIKSNKKWGNDWGVSFTITPVIKNPFMSM